MMLSLLLTATVLGQLSSACISITPSTGTSYGSYASYLNPAAQVVAPQPVLLPQQAVAPQPITLFQPPPFGVANAQPIFPNAVQVQPVINSPSFSNPVVSMQLIPQSNLLPQPSPLSQNSAPAQVNPQSTSPLDQGDSSVPQQREQSQQPQQRQQSDRNKDRIKGKKKQNSDDYYYYYPEAPQGQGEGTDDIAYYDTHGSQTNNQQQTGEQQTQVQHTNNNGPGEQSQNTRNVCPSPVEEEVTFFVPYNAQSLPTYGQLGPKNS
ncbi:hypothetical protein RB195_000760 [Necator americanus]|uniref:Uncharacterized protein n=1 Tax=Necator americanus TaxID=51031 RepID=A0ABR1DBX7_NECAM